MGVAAQEKSGARAVTEGSSDFGKKKGTKQKIWESREGREKGSFGQGENERQRLGG